MTHISTPADTRPHSDRFRGGGRERNRLAALIRSLVLVCLWGSIAGLAGTCRGQAGGEKPVAAKPAGARVGYTLILFGCEDTVVKAAGIDMHKTLGGPYLGTWHDMKGQKGIGPGRLRELERGDFDMLLLATPHCYPDAGAWAGAVGLDSTPARSALVLNRTAAHSALGSFNSTPVGAASVERQTSVSPERYSTPTTPSFSTTVARSGTVSATASGLGKWRVNRKTMNQERIVESAVGIIDRNLVSGRSAVQSHVPLLFPNRVGVNPASRVQAPKEQTSSFHSRVASADT